MDESFFNIVTKGKHFASFSVDLGMSRDIVLKLTIEVIVSNAEDIKVLLALIDLNVKWEVGLEESISFVTMLSKGSVCNTIFVFMKRWDISDIFLDFENQGLDHTSAREEFSSSDFECITSFDFLEEFWGLRVSVAVEELSVFDSHSMDHRVAIEPVVSAVRRNKIGVWSISEVDSADVIRNFTLNHIDALVGLLLSNWSEVTLKNWVLLRVNFELTVKIELNRPEEKPKRELV